MRPHEIREDTRSGEETVAYVMVGKGRVQWRNKKNQGRYIAHHIFDPRLVLSMSRDSYFLREVLHGGRIILGERVPTKSCPSKRGARRVHDACVE